MAKKKTAASRDSSVALGYEAQLWQMADALLGRNVTGGAVRVRTIRLTGESGGRLKAAAESGSGYVLAGSIEGPHSDGVRATVNRPPHLQLLH